MTWNSEIQSMGPDELHNFCMTADRDEIIENIGGITGRLCALLPVDLDADKKNLDQRFREIEDKIEKMEKRLS